MLPEKQRIALTKGQAELPGREETQAQQKAETAAEAIQEQHAVVLREREVIILEEVIVLEVLPVVLVIPGPPLLPAVEVEQIKALDREVLALPEVVEVAVENLQAQGEVRHGI